MPVEAVRYEDDAILLVDQTLLPHELYILRITRIEDLCEAIRSLRVRGAPAIGVAAAYGFRLAAENFARRGAGDAAALRQALRETGAALAATRPTARNLFMAVDHMLSVALEAPGTVAEIAAAVAAAADRLHREDRALCLAIASHGVALVPSKAQILTHCNAGALATGGIGTALGIVYEAVRLGKSVHVFANETRPLLQGARLTVWELGREGIPVTLLCDNAAAALLGSGGIDCVLVGADRIARNGDTANKIGTLSVAVAARRFGVPFYVAAPSTTFDLALDSGAEIPIEERAPSEVTRAFGARIAPEETGVFNPAFDVTPADLITAIVHEYGVVRPPYVPALEKSLRT